jgi:hypothetical protein
MDYRRISSPSEPYNPGVFLFYTSRAGVQNNTNTASVYRQLGAAPLYNQVALFVQDEWRAMPRLSISAGLRWELNPPPTSQNNIKPQRLLGSFAQPATLAFDLSGRPVYDMQYGAVAPRLGFAWRAHDSSITQTVVRGGAGLFYDTGASAASTIFSGPAFSKGVSYTNLSIPVPQSQFSFSPSANPPYTSTTYAVVPNFHLPYTIQWNAALEQALGRNQALTISYVGSEGEALVESRSNNVSASNPAFVTIVSYANVSTSNYQSLQVQFQRQLSRGLQTLASYTWSHALDYGSTDTAIPYVRGNSDFDLRNSASGAISWDIPSHIKYLAAREIVSGWALDGRFVLRTGFPVNLVGATYFDPSTGSTRYSQLNLVSAVPIYLYSSNYPGSRAINRAAFQTAPTNSPGNSPRNFTRGFGAGQLDLAARREFALGERLRMQFRAEAFNLTNHPNFGYVDPTLADAQFGQSTKSLSQSLTTQSALYQQGGPRSLQFALKLHF